MAVMTIDSGPQDTVSLAAPPVAGS